MSFTSFMQSIFGNKSQRDMRLIQPMVQTVLDQEANIRALSHDELRAKSQEIKTYVQTSVAQERETIRQLWATIENTPLDERESIFNQIDKIEKDILERLEHVLDEVMPVAFCIIKDTARRFFENADIIVTATDFDRQLAANPANDFISIDGDKAVYHNEWTAGGNKIKWDMIHYDVQLFGGIALHQGKIAEMATGEGKTLVATLPVFLNALTGNGVHVVTVNDYLAKRDSEWMGPLYMFNGLSVDCIDKHRPNSAERRRAYEADITFGTNNEFGFDYLRDNMAISPADLVQRGHNYAIVDEVDSVLIDDARTPLIISGPIPKGDDQMFEEYQPLVERLVNVQRTLATQFLAEAKTKIANGTQLTEGGKKDDGRKTTDEGFLALFRSYKALPKNKALIKYLSEEGIKSGMLKTEEFYMQNNNREMPKAVEPLYFVVDEKLNSCDLTDKGVAWLAHQVHDDKLFVLPDITTELSQLDAETNLTEEQRLDKKDELLAHYAVQSERVHTLQQLLKAYCMFNRDDEYVVIDGEVKIVDEQTGRIMEGRRWSDGLHQAVEAKEHVKVEAATQTFASITLQNYFRMYHKLAGMTGTAITEAGELWDIYKLDVVEIPTNRPVIRNDMDDRVYKTNREKYRAVIQEIIAMREAGRPTLVGTTSVEISELLKRMLDQNRIPCQVLNAKLHQKEADIVAQAGRSVTGTVMVDGHPEERKLGVVTIATNMAGRGTDIKLSDEVRQAGGLAIIGTERHESRRVDRQLRGRSGRQGDPGSSVFFVSLEDKLMRLFGSDRIAGMMDRLGFKEGERIESSMISKQIERAQKKVEENHFGTRKHLLEYDDVMNKQRTVIYEKRHHALMGERIGMDIANILWDRVIHIITANDYIGCREEFLKVLAMECPFTEQEFLAGNYEELQERAFQIAMDNFTRRTDRIQEVAAPVIARVFENEGNRYERIMVPITDGRHVYNIPCDLRQAYDTQGKQVVKEFERVILLHIIDDCWKENLRQLDELRHSVQNASYEQKDPLLIFKLESVTLFDDMVNNMNNRIASILMRAAIPEQMSQQQVREAMPEQRSQRYNETKADADAPRQGGGMQQAAAQDTRESAHRPTQPIVKEKLPGRNDPCPCGSGKKFKNCHGRSVAMFIFLVASALMAQLSLAQTGTITVNTNQVGAQVQPTMYGIFFEDINFAADGGLYAELVKNRSFEFTPDHLAGWQSFGGVTIRDDGPFDKNPHYVRLTSTGHPEWWTGLVNEGFFGIGVKDGSTYRLSLYARVPDGKPQMLRVQLIDPYTQQNKQQFLSEDILVKSSDWQKYEVTMECLTTCENARLRIFLCEPGGKNGKGTCDVEHVSLFPVDTWRGHENGLRKDLAQALYDMHPGLLRFPGGCIVEGVTLDNRYNWKNTIGPVENRPLNKNRWESTFTYRYYPDYFQTYGLGFYEFFLLSEEIGAEPLPILNVGMACQFQNKDYKDRQAYAEATQEGLQEFIDDCLDLIEFANGDSTTTWGALRAEMGHPAPFNVKFLGIGNEQWETPYYDRLEIVSQAVRKAHPEIKIVGTSGPDGEGKQFNHGWNAMRRLGADLVDEHYYRPIKWFKDEWTRYDNYDRNGPKVFAGEYACHDKGKKWNHAGASIYEAAFMTDLERNADVVWMSSYAPLFAHVDGWQWRPDAIWFDNLRVAKTTSYYVQALYAQNKGTNLLPITNSLFPAKGEDGVLASAVLDNTTGEYIVKVANTCDDDKDLSIVMDGLTNISQVLTTTLDLSDYDAENTVDNPDLILPVESSLPADSNTIHTTIPAKHFTVYKIK